MKINIRRKIMDLKKGLFRGSMLMLFFVVILVVLGLGFHPESVMSQDSTSSE